MTVLLTGSTGFIGSALTRHLQQQGYALTAAVRHCTDDLPAGVRPVVTGGLLPDTDWTQALTGVDTVIHLAARVHVMHDTTADPLKQFRHANTATTLQLARQAAATGTVRRFIFLSSIKVNGECTQPDKPFTAAVAHAPSDPYALSKYEAEQGLTGIARQSGMAVVIIRPPLVYGDGVKGNFHSMMHWLNKGIPLPLGSLHNQRSLVALPNLVDLISTCIRHPAAANQTLLASDGEDLSTTALLQRLSRALDKPARLLPVPQPLLQGALTLLGKPAIAQRLCGHLQVDSRDTRRMLSWTPPVSVGEALRQTATAYRRAQG